MPTYEYRCLDCGHHFEAFQSMQATPLHACPKCNGRVERLISGGTGLIFKGSGFYITDYKRNRGETKPERPKAEKKAESAKKEDLKQKAEEIKEKTKAED